ncbi:MAG: phosphoenolpyruvate--protein phosphotransferase [Anaerolineales bacterium]|nr:phosphoenolpyruvate--protein phosphotransferase [Anaerolineales bacterium]
MVGLVLVSHSRALAHALLALARQVASPEVPIAVAAGVGTDRLEFGTDAVEIHDAIENVYSADGVLVLMDLGSAILSAEMALQLLPPEKHAHIRFCPAPLVEGTITAAVQAGLGNSLDTVFTEASQALLPKLEQLGGAPAPTSAPLPTTGQEITLALRTAHGLHARPAAKFVQTAGRFDATIFVRNQTTGKGPVSAKSLNALATLGALFGHEITIVADGPDASNALAALTHLVQDNFGERESSASPTPHREPHPTQEALPLQNGALPVVAISEGIALGPLARLVAPPPTVPEHPTDNPALAWDRFEAALAQVSQDIRTRRDNVAARAGREEAGIFDAHLLILNDPDLLTQAQTQITAHGMNEAHAWHTAIQTAQAAYLALDDPYLRQRAADVGDVGEQVLRALLGEDTAPLTFSTPVILAAEDLTPTQTAQLDITNVLGLATVLGGPTSHSAILARSLGIPAVSSAPQTIMALAEGTLIGLDGGRGGLWVSPSESVQAELNARREAWLAQRAQWRQTSQQPALTTDGHPIEIVANVGNLADARAAMENGAEGIGLLRTEFLFLSRTTAPDEDEQYHALRDIFETMGDRPVIVRTMDVGGDKPLAYISQPVEANPFLGVRGLRLSLQRPDLFSTQLRAILRAGEGYPVRIMFPMVSNVDEVLRARQILSETHTMLETEGLPHAWPVETGIMIEVPSAALLAPILAPHVDFFSVGTNDLTQYTLAAERGNPNLPGFADALHPAVLKLIWQVAEAARAAGKWVGVCGELAGDPVAAPVLIGLGVKELSLNPAGIPRIKAVVRKSTFAEAQTFAQTVLLAEDAPSARKLAENFLV